MPATSHVKSLSTLTLWGENRLRVSGYPEGRKDWWTGHSAWGTFSLRQSLLRSCFIYPDESPVCHLMKIKMTDSGISMTFSWVLSPVLASILLPWTFVTRGCGVASLPNSWFKASPSALNWGCWGRGTLCLSLDDACDSVWCPLPKEAKHRFQAPPRLPTQSKISAQSLPLTLRCSVN